MTDRPMSVDGDETSAGCTPVGPMDNFDDGVTSAEWSPSANPPVTIAETQGQLVITLANASAGSRYGSYDTGGLLDLRDHCVFVTAVAVPRANPNVEMTLQISVNAGSLSAGIRMYNGLLDAFTRNSGGLTSHADPIFDPVQHARWRLRELTGTFYWETSPDGNAWTIQFSEPTPFGVAATKIEMFAGTSVSVANPGQAIFDRFNLP